MPYKQKNSPFKQTTTDGDINVTSTTSKSEAARRKAEERKNKKIKNQRDKAKRVKLPGRVEDQNIKPVKLPFTGDKAKMVKF